MKVYNTFYNIYRALSATDNINRISCIDSNNNIYAPQVKSIEDHPHILPYAQSPLYSRREIIIIIHSIKLNVLYRRVNTKGIKLLDSLPFFNLSSGANKNRS